MKTAARPRRPGAKRQNRSLWEPGALLKELGRGRAKKKVVFTNGCFDLMHVGHLKVLESAKKLGNVLVVALNSDDSVRRLKGPKRPLIPLEDRAALMASLRPVDYVTYFEEDTPAELLKRVKPDVLVKGGDWAADAIAGREHAKRVARVPLVPGRSTTQLIGTIVERYCGKEN